MKEVTDLNPTLIVPSLGGRNPMVKYLLLAFVSSVAIGIGANLLFQIQVGDTLGITLACISCLPVQFALFLTCKAWYYQGRIDAIKEYLKKTTVGQLPEEEANDHK